LLPGALLNTQFYELVCVHVHSSMTKLSHGCGWCFLPAVWAGEAALKFIVDIIIRNYPLYSDWLTELPNIFGLPGSGKTSPDGWLGAWFQPDIQTLNKGIKFRPLLLFLTLREPAPAPIP
jgi:hypothetical protein